MVMYQRVSWSRNLAGPSKLVLQNPQSSFHILSSSHLSIMKVKFFRTLGVWKWLDDSIPPWINLIYKVIPKVVCATICLKIHARSSPLANFVKRGDRCNTLIWLQGPDIPKYACQMHVPWWATASRMIVESLLHPLNCPCHVAGQFFHFQCMQSMEPSISNKPRALFICKSLVMS